MNRKSVLAISGSTREQSTNGKYIRAIAALTSDRLDLQLYDGLSRLPHFNPDLDTDYPPVEVANFRRLLAAADGVLICTPEYAMGVPGSLKNALDWTVSSSGFSGKPVAAITASSLGQKAHASLLETLKVIEAKMEEDTQLLISYAVTKLGPDQTIQDPETLGRVERLIRGFIGMME